MYLGHLVVLGDACDMRAPAPPVQVALMSAVPVARLDARPPTGRWKATRRDR